MPKVYKTSSGLPMVVVDGVPRIMGCLKPDPNLSMAVPAFTNKFKVLPRSQWTDNTQFHDLGKIVVRDQGEYGSCTGQGSVNALSASKRTTAPGDDFPLLSATFIYGNINGGRDDGAQVSQAMQAIVKWGTCLDSQVPETMIYAKDFPADAYETAKRFKAFEVYRLRNFDELCTALTLGFPCASGIAVGNNFMQSRLNHDGIAPLPDQIVGGHCLAHLGLKKISGQWVVQTVNSWSTRWGINGWCYLQEGAWNAKYGFPFDAFMVYTINEDPNDSGDDVTPIK